MLTEYPIEYLDIDPHEVAFPGECDSFVKLSFTSVNYRKGSLHAPFCLDLGIEVSARNSCARLHDTFPDRIYGLPSGFRSELRAFRQGDRDRVVFPTQFMELSISKQAYGARSGIVLEGRHGLRVGKSWPRNVAKPVLVGDDSGALIDVRFAFLLRNVDDPSVLREPIEQLDALIEYFSWFE